MALAYDTSNSGGAASTSSVSFSLTLASGAAIFAGLTRASTTDPTSVTWNTTENLTIVGAKVDGTNAFAWCYYLSNPTSGTLTFAANWAGNSNTGAGVWSFTGVDTGGTAYGTLDTWGATSGDPTGIDVSADMSGGDLAIGFCAAHGSGTITITKTAGTSTERFIQTNPGGAWMSLEGVTDTAGTPTWTISAGDGRVAFALAVNEAGGGAAPRAMRSYRQRRV